jgi:myo-inositol-1(or 4)-monophosphatase
VSADLDLIREAALEAGELALARRRKGLKVEYKVGGSPVTDADLAVDAFLKQRLRAARPDYAWLSEETADAPERLAARKLFVVDPVDGTRAYVKDKPWFAVCIGLVEDGEATLGVVHAPALKETFEAARGGPALLNGAPIRPSTTEALAGCRMLGDPRLFAYPGWREPWPAMQVESRNSIAYRMCLVADGRYDAAVALNVKYDWDVAAAGVIVEAAGALATDHKGRRFVYNKPQPWQESLVCAAPALHPLILARTAPIDLPPPKPA